ncbi:diguanylate cyclase [compost metagenome]
MQLPCGQLKVTLSIGCTLFAKGETLDDALERADTGLYTAKQNGRDRVVYVAPPL